ncbi:SPOR domain-containing protein [Flavobacterium silvaticum]|uniref:SPOR domain-containing protein n=1 Tax=Flavobacterium silvaticum TaxID=1852020 RepID=A0A972FYB7_9FLAO|nr:SPOR domain-containing protein [Flavobacterium silvaticum]NMH27081.1 SPOR domain-containing protein [Flavobacterium silvaticum]
MNFRSTKSAITTFVIAVTFSISGLAQQGNVTVSQDPKFDQMLTEKRRINPSLTTTDRYKIQIFNGDSETSKKILTSFRNDFKEYDATIVFSTPAYKVWVGSFKSRVEAERNLELLRKKYSNAIIVKPNK